MATAVELRSLRSKARDEQKALIDRAEAENRDFTAEENEQFTRANADIDSLSARLERQEQMERTPASEGEQRHAPQSQDGENRGAQTPFWQNEEYSKAYRSWLRTGEVAPVLRTGFTTDRGDMYRSAGAAQHRALSTNAMTAGGYIIAPEDFAAGIERAMLFYGGMRQVAQVITTDNGADLPYPVSDDTSNTGEIINENTAVSEQDVTFGQRLLKAHLYSSKMVRVPVNLVQDSAFDLDGFLRDTFAERLGRIQNTHFTVGGAGANGPTGITQSSVAGKTGASTTAILPDELIDLEHSVDIAYRNQGCRWMMHDSILLLLRKLKDGDGQYLWQPGMQAGAPNSINGYPYTVNNDMASSVGSGNITVLFGQLNRYKIRDVKGFTLLRLVERYAEMLQVAFFAYSRADGLLIDAGTNPVKHLTH